MSIHVALRHRTSYKYDRLVEHGPHVVRLRPAAHSKTRVLSYALKVGPGEHFINWQQDPQGNYLGRLVFHEEMKSLDVEVNLVVEMAVHNPFDFFLEEKAENYPFSYDKEVAHELAPFLEVEDAGRRMTHCINYFRKKTGRTIDVLVELNSAAQKAVEYKIRMEPGVQTPEETLEKGSGSCRDSAWMLVNVLRGMGLAARFVSGYLIQLKADQESLDGPAAPRSISPISTLGPKSISQEPDGSVLIPLPGSWRARVTYRSHVPRAQAVPPRSRAAPAHASPPWSTRCR